MSEITFEWDERKAEQNERKHGISFEEAQTAFEDDHARLTHDPDHSQDEDRYILLGMSAVLRILVVCHVYRENDEVIRLISARKATKREQQQYQRFLR
ncbi:BrnT family toxin [Leptolyngbya iicbica]|uniref:BrnT family toxin n=1 Tax=Lyngbya confervoides BDU141951 TaxID=1574623 RepID=A0A0C1Y5P4_9CYAN